MHIEIEMILSCIVISVACLFIFIVSWRKESHCAFILTPFLVIMINEIIRILPGFVYAAAVGISKDSYAMIVFFTGFVSLICGFFVALGYLRYKPSTPSMFIEKGIIVKSEREVLIAIVCGAIFLIIAGLYMYDGIPMVSKAIFGIISGGDASDIAQQVSANRMQLTKGHYWGGAYKGQGVLSTLIRTGWPLLVCMACIVYWKMKNIKWLTVALVLFILSFMFVAGDGTRGPFVNTIIIYIILASLLTKVGFKFVVTSMSSIVLLGIALGLYSAKMHNILGDENFFIRAIGAIFSRILIGNSISDVYAIEFVREGVIELRMGMIHFRDIIASFPGVAGGLPFSNELALLINPMAKFSTFASGTYIRKVYVDFGILGVGIIFLFTGLIAGFSQVFIFKKMKKEPFQLAIGVMLIYFTGRLVMNSFISVMSSIIMLVLFCFLMKMALKTYRVLNYIIGHNIEANDALR